MFYDHYCELCRKKGVTPSRAAIDAGISKSLVTKWKLAGTELPSPDVIKRLSNYFCISVSEVLGAETKKEPSTVSGEKLTEAESALLELFRLVPEDQREMVLGMIRVALGNR